MKPIHWIYGYYASDGKNIRYVVKEINSNQMRIPRKLKKKLKREAQIIATFKNKEI